MTKGVDILEPFKGKYGYAHWSGGSLEPGHKLILVPQSMFDSWEGYCSCGKWKGIASLYEFTRDQAIAALEKAHREHVK